MYRSCEFKGCGTKLAAIRYMQHHLSLPHVRCSCSWVGTYWGKHMAMMRRVGDEREHVQLGLATAKRSA